MAKSDISHSSWKSTGLDLESAMPLYFQLKIKIIDMIRKRGMAPGDRLPNEAELAKEFEISVGTVKKTLGLLVNEGVLFRKQGRGTFLKSGKDEFTIVPQTLAKVADFESSIWMRLNVVGTGAWKDSKVKKYLNIQAKDDATCFQISFGLPENPPLFCEICFPALKWDLEKSPAKQWSTCYDGMLARTQHIRETMTAILSNPHIRQNLSMDKDDAILLVRKEFLGSAREMLACAAFFARPEFFTFVTVAEKNPGSEHLF